MTSPPAIPGSDPTAVVGRRIAAYALDFLLMLLVIVPIGVWSFTANATDVSSTTHSCSSDSVRSSADGQLIDSTFCVELGDRVYYLVDDAANQFTYLVYGSGFTAQVLNLVVLQGLTGASVGKFATGLRVARMETGRRAGFGRIVLRWLLLLVDALCCILPGIVLVASTKGHRRLGDMAAGTVVVRRESLGRGPIPVPGLNTAVPEPSWGGSQTGWGAPPAPGGWQEPPTGAGSPTPGWGPPASTPPTAPEEPPTEASPPTSPPTPSGDGPIWDEARATYIQFDRARDEWVQWDEAASEWRPISR